MDKLNKQNQSWLDDESVNAVDFMVDINVIESETVKAKLLEMQTEIDNLNQKYKEIRNQAIEQGQQCVESDNENYKLKAKIERLKAISEYTFKHPKTNEVRKVSIDRQFIVDSLIDELYEKIECNCTIGGDSLYLGCDCNEYFAEFDLIEPSKE